MYFRIKQFDDKVCLCLGFKCACEDPAGQHQFRNGEGSQHRGSQVCYITVPSQKDRLQTYPRHIEE